MEALLEFLLLRFGLFGWLLVGGAYTLLHWPLAPLWFAARRRRSVVLGGVVLALLAAGVVAPVATALVREADALAAAGPVGAFLVAWGVALAAGVVPFAGLLRGRWRTASRQ